MSVYEQINRIKNEVDEQADLIAQIATALEGKVGGSGGGSIATYTGTVYGRRYSLGDLPEPVYFYLDATMTLRAVAVPKGESVQITIVAGTFVCSTGDFGVLEKSENELIEQFMYDSFPSVYIAIPTADGFEIDFYGGNN